MGRRAGRGQYINQVPANAHRGFNIVRLPLPDTTGCGAVLLPAA